MADTTSGNVSPSKGTVIYFERQALKWAGPMSVLDKFGMSKPMPKNKGTVIEFRRPVVFTAKTIPLSEGVTPSASSFSYEVVQATLKQYGDISSITDVIEDTNLDPVLNDMTVQHGENIGRTIEALTYGVLKAGTQVEYSNGTVRTDVNQPLVLAKIRAAVRTLQAQKGMRISRVVDSSPDFSTFAVEPGYVATGHTDLANDIREIPGFIPVVQYGSKVKIHEFEFGATEDLRFVLTPDHGPFEDGGGAKSGSGTEMVSTSGTSADVYPVLVLAKEAYGTIPLKGMGAIEPTIIPVNMKTKDDPLGQRGYVGWKTWFVAKILNENWIVRIECAATAL